jgi:hypothetical protein
MLDYAIILFPVDLFQFVPFKQNKTLSQPLYSSSVLLVVFNTNFIEEAREEICIENNQQN